MPAIDISKSTYKLLLAASETFEDTPESVILRLLGQAQAGGARSGSARRGRAAPGSILPEREYWRPLLEYLVDEGGEAHANDAIDAMEPRLRNKLREADYDELDMGETRWRNRVRFARLRMKEQGLLDRNAPRGIWRITAKGRKYVA